MEWYVLYRHRGAVRLVRTSDEQAALEQAQKLAETGSVVTEIGYLGGRRRRVLKRTMPSAAAR